VIILTAFNPSPRTGAGNHTYLFTGPEPLLVDAGVGDPRHLEAIAAALGSTPLAQVVVTHNHADHASGVDALAARWPSAVFLKKPWPGRDDRHGVRWRPLEDGDLVRAGDVELTAVWTPGHAPDHLCLYDVARGELYGGDLLVRGGTVVIPASAGGSLAQYLASLERVRALAPVRVHPAHGPAIEDPAALIDEYVAHRELRESQVAAALASGDTTPAAITARVYPALDPALLDFAEDSVLAHLIKLEEEGRAWRGPNGWAKS